MPGETTAVVTGTVQGTPQLRYTPAGTPAVRLTVRQIPRTYDHKRGAWREAEPQDVLCTVAGPGARHAAASLADGVHVVAVGELRIGDRLYLDRAQLAVSLTHHVAYVDDTLPAVLAGQHPPTTRANSSGPGPASGPAGTLGSWSGGGMTWTRPRPAAPGHV